MPAMSTPRVDVGDGESKREMEVEMKSNGKSRSGRRELPEAAFPASNQHNE